VVKGQLTVRPGARLLKLSERQVQRLKRRVAQSGVAALAHGNVGRRPINARPLAVHEKVVELVGGLLKDATCAQVADLLAERHGMRVSARSVRRILARAQLSNRHARQRTRRRRSRDRMPQEGLLVPCDASP